MKLYVNTKEVPYLKDALRRAADQSNHPTYCDCLLNLLERVELCEALQKSERRAKKEEVTNND